MSLFCATFWRDQQTSLVLRSQLRPAYTHGYQQAVSRQAQRTSPETRSTQRCSEPPGPLSLHTDWNRRCSAQPEPPGISLMAEAWHGAEERAPCATCDVSLHGEGESCEEQGEAARCLADAKCTISCNGSKPRILWFFQPR